MGKSKTPLHCGSHRTSCRREWPTHWPLLPADANQKAALFRVFVIDLKANFDFADQVTDTAWLDGLVKRFRLATKIR